MGNKTVGSNYQTLGDLHVDFGTTNQSVADYRRELNLETAVASVRYRLGAVSFTREMFSSAPDQALVIRLMADQPGSHSFTIHLSRPGNKAKFEVSGNEIIMREHVGNGTGVQMAARLNVFAQGGSVRVSGETLRVEKADAVTLLLTAATDYRGGDPLSTAGSQSQAAAK